MCGGDPQCILSGLCFLHFSPHVRGWSLMWKLMLTGLQLFPACAGVIPVKKQIHQKLKTFPRMCGGDPYNPIEDIAVIYFSPHVRGWSWGVTGQKLKILLFPACAGVILTRIKERSYFIAFPRMCGGDPFFCKSFALNNCFSPHVRGWSLFL